jgi:uncharacterized protein with FMN-binding domain
MNKKMRGLILCTVCLSFLAALASCVVEYDPTKVEKSGGWTGAKDGTFDATENDATDGGGGSVKVILTIASEYITDAAVTGTAGLASQGYGADVIKAAPALITASNGTPLDGFSGATITRDAINRAVKAALTKAGATAAGTADLVSADLDLTGLVTAPGKDAAPVTTFADQTQYTGTIAWFESDGTTSVSGTFAALTVYKAVLTLTAKTGYTFTGIAADAFSYTGATAVTNAAGSGTVTIEFAATGSDAVVSDLALSSLVTAPATAGTPQASFPAQTQYTGTIAWFESDGTTSAPATFAAGTVYKAVLTLAATSGYTFTGVAANAFSHTGQAVATNAAGSGTVTIIFPSTALAGTTYSGEGIGYHNRPGQTGANIVLDVTFSGNTVTGYTIKSHKESSGVDGLGGLANRPAVATVWPNLWTAFKGETVPITGVVANPASGTNPNAALAALDAVSGATYSWTGFVEAINDAYSKVGAGGNQFNDTVYNTTPTDDDDYNGLGSVTVTITVVNGAITNVLVSGTDGLASPDYGQEVIAAANNQIVGPNWALPPGIDVVSGGTAHITWQAIYDALANAKTKAAL